MGGDAFSYIYLGFVYFPTCQLHQEKKPWGPLEVYGNQSFLQGAVKKHWDKLSI